MPVEVPIDLFGIECGAGWNCLTLPLIKRCRREGVRVAQIKEKFGGLRFYVYNELSESMQLAVDDAEELSYTICEECGEPGERRSGGWVKTLCDKHHQVKENTE